MKLRKPVGAYLTLVGMFAWPATTVAQAAPAAGAEDDEPGVARVIEIGQSRLSFFGFVRVDAIYDDSRPDRAQTPFFIRSEGPASTGEENFTLHPRLTRLGIDVTGPRLQELGGAALSGRVEVDFQAGGGEARQQLRLRHGWMKLTWDEMSLLLGQTWDLASPLFPTVNSDTLMWNAGNLGDRRPQIRVDYQPAGDGARFFAAGALGLTGAVDSQDLDDDGIRDGERSGLPHLQGRLGVSFPAAAGRRLTLGVSGHLAEEEVSTPIAGEETFDSTSVSLDYEIPLAARATVKGELWSGENLSDFRGGIGQGVNTATGEEIDSDGGWIEIGVDATERYSFYAGYTVDDPDDAQVPAGGRIENSAWYLVNRFKFGKPFLVGIDYLRWTTEFKGLPDGVDNRFNLYIVYNF